LENSIAGPAGCRKTRDDGDFERQLDALGIAEANPLWEIVARTLSMQFEGQGYYKPGTHPEDR
jgi:hypothetical protein